MTLLRLILLIAFAVIGTMACGNGKSLEGKRYVSVGGTDYIQFLSDGRFETPLGSSVIEGDYAFEDDGRIRLTVEMRGIRQVAYATTGNADGMVIEFEADIAQRYFPDGDDRIQRSVASSETVLRTSARYCARSRCMGILPSESPVTVTDVGIVINESYHLSFNDILEIELAEVRRNPRFSVAVKMSPQYERAAFGGGWTEYRFASEDTRNVFYMSLGRALNDWHAEYGVRQFALQDFAIANAPVTSPEAKEDDRGNREQERVQATKDNIIGFWRDDEENAFIAFRKDGTTDIYQNGELQMTATYSVVSEDLISVKFEEGDGSLERDEVPITLDAYSLTLAGDSLRRVTEAEFLEILALDGRDTAAPDQIQQGLSQAAIMKAAVTEAYLNSGKLPSNNMEAGLADEINTAAPNVTRLQITQGGIIEIRFGPEADRAIAGRTMQLRPRIMRDSVLWECFVTAPLASYAPEACIITDESTSTQRRQR